MGQGRIFVDSFVLNGIDYFTVTADPNGSLTAPIGSVAFRIDAGNASLEYRNTDGSTTWVAAGGGTTFTARPLSAGALAQDPLTAISSASYGAASSITLKNQAPGNINGSPPNCAVWRWLIADPFDFTAFSQIAMQLKLTGTPNDSYILYIGIYDGTIDTGRGVYGSLACNNGATGAQQMGSTPVTGNSAAGISAAGGSLECVFNLDADSDRGQGILVRSTSNTGPAYGRIERVQNPTNWAGTALYGFFAIGKTSTGTGGTFAGIEIQDYAIPVFA